MLYHVIGIFRLSHFISFIQRILSLHRAFLFNLTSIIDIKCNGDQAKSNHTLGDSPFKSIFFRLSLEVTPEKVCLFRDRKTFQGNYITSIPRKENSLTVQKVKLMMTEVLFPWSSLIVPKTVTMAVRVWRMLSPSKTIWQKERERERCQQRWHCQQTKVQTWKIEFSHRNWKFPELNQRQGNRGVCIGHGIESRRHYTRLPGGML